MFERLKEARARVAAERQERERLERERVERELQAEKERLMALSEKELMIEILLQLKRVDSTCETISSKCDDIEWACDRISSNVRLYSD